MILFNRTDSEDADFQKLVKMLDQDLQARDGADNIFYAQFNKIQAIRNVVVCYKDQMPVACGAFKMYDQNTVEIKRMFVLPQYRGQGTGLAVLTELERWAAENGYRACILETGKRQPEAIGLYQKAGYGIIKNYGQYEHVENSVCMRKEMLF